MAALTARGFNVAHQKVSVDVDIATNKLHGWSELTIVPTTADLREVVLDARQMSIIKAQINGKDAQFHHNDTVSNPPQNPESWSVHQYHLHKEKMSSLFKDQAPGDLCVVLPEGVSVTDQDTSSTFIMSHIAQEKNYEPLTVRVYFETHGPTAGVSFVGGQHTSVDCSSWHAYTTHSPIGQASSTWMPCVDGFAGLCTWEIEFAVPKTLKDMIPSEDRMKVDSTVPNGENEDPSSVNPDENAEQDDEDDDDDDDDEQSREIVVICNNNSPNQVAHPTDPSKKLVSFEMFTPIFAQHVGFAVGPFVQTIMSSGNDDADESSNASNVPFCIFSLPSKTSMVQNSCGIFTKALDFFTRDFGSFPFSSYSICFVSDFPYDSADAAGLTIATDRLLFPKDVIEPVFTNTEPLIRCLAAQWCGVNIVAHSYDDLWITEGVSHYMTHLFVRKLMGNNEYRFRMRAYADEITRQDINMPPLADPQFSFPVFPDDLKFIRLKAPMILYILDRRMTKTDRSLGLSRVIPKLFLQSMSGDLNAQISTPHFIKTCEKVAHHRLDKFFADWVYGSGYPIFRITQRFNKKRMFIEMGIGQVQSREIPPEEVRDEQFLERAVQELLRQKEGKEIEVASVFAGPMTIRIHEADGTPYEHVVFLKDSFTKLDIQYNTKYKRLKRTQKFRSGGGDNYADEQEGGSGGLIHCMGDVLMRDKDIDSWKLSDWGQDDEEYMFNEAFEWIRVDSDFEWIGKFFVGQPDYMYASQLQQDRDVVAQFEAVMYFASQPPNAIYSSILTRTLMDRRYFYNVRVHAALGLVSSAVENLKYLGKFHLFKAFQEMFCFEDSLIPRANNFSDFATYFVQKAIATALGYIRDSSGQSPQDVKDFLLGLIRYNENSGNSYSDSQYISTLMTAAVNTLRPLDNDASPIDLNDTQTLQFVGEVIAEIDKGQRLDRWVPSYNNVVSLTAIRQDELLIRTGYGKPRLDKLLLSTKPDVPANIRLAAFQSLLNLGGARNPELLKYVFQVGDTDPSPYIRLGILRAICTYVGVVALRGEYYPPGEAHHTASAMQERQNVLARRAVRTAIPVLREALRANVTLQQEIWKMLSKPTTSALERRLLFEISEVVYEPVNSLIVTMPSPNLYRVAAKRKRDYMIVVKYRSLLKKRKEKHEAPVVIAEPKPPALKLKLGLGKLALKTET